VRLSRRQFVVGAGAVGVSAATGVGLLAGCGRLPWQGQVPPKAYRLGWLTTGALTGDGSPGFAALLQGLRDRGYIDGQNISLVPRYAEGYPDRLPDLAAELVGLPVDVIVAAGGGPAALAAQQATTTIPIVIIETGDAVTSGLAASLGRPGANITGVSLMSPVLSGKRLQLLKETLPGMSRVAVLWSADNSAVARTFEETQAAAETLGLHLQSLEVRGPNDLERAFEAATREESDALMTLPDPFMLSQRTRIGGLAVGHRLPGMNPFREYVDAGGLMSYGPSLLLLFQRATYLVDRILKGAKPADLPVEQPMTFDFVVNLKTARELGITFPNEIMLQVTDVIQ
jgi:putative ABC transport system substrate-binding protein